MKNKWLKRLFLLFLTPALLIPTALPVSAATPAYDFEAIGSYLANEFEKAHVPGASVVIVNKEEVLFESTYGNCTSVDASFAIGSLSKSFTAMAIMQLVEKGQADLDSPISAYLPQAPQGDRITVRQLLNQTSGIRMYASQDEYEITSTQGSYEYAGSNYGLLGQIIETVSGLTYEAYIEENIFKPVSMEHSYTLLENAEGNGLIDGYRNYFGFTVKQKVTPPEPGTKAWLSIPAGYLVSSASDIGKYLQVYLNGGAGLLSPESVDAMFYENYDRGYNYFYGLGWQLNTNLSAPYLFHDGDVENYMTYMAILPESEIGISIMTNTSDYLVANSMIYNICSSVPLFMMGEQPVIYEETHYWKEHLLYDLICLAAVVISFIPLMRAQKWLRRTSRPKLRTFRYIFAAAVHLVLPTVILLLPMILGYPMSVISGFVPDLHLILFITAFALYGTGIYKLIRCVLNHSKHKNTAYPAAS